MEPTRNETISLSTVVNKSYGAVQTTTTNCADVPSSFDTTSTTSSDSKLDLSSSSSDEVSTSSFHHHHHHHRPKGICGRLLAKLDPTEWLMAAAEIKNHQKKSAAAEHYRARRWSGFLAMLVRDLIYNPSNPQFTNVQLHAWAVILGVIMGLYTFLWKNLIDSGIELVWVTIPRCLYEEGIFTDEDGDFPLYHYMWIVPALFGGPLSYIFVTVPQDIPDQNAWIKSVHCRGMHDYGGFWILFVLSTLGMISGLSLGPELPLVLTGSFVGAWFSNLCQQNILHTRILSLTSASAAVGGFFGFPMAGAFFVLELPHDKGIEYFEAVGPSVLASIVAVLMNRWLNNEEIMTGYFEYPAMTESLPGGMFSIVLVLGLFGALVGYVYAKLTKQIKTWVHDWFRAPSDYCLLTQQDLSSSTGSNCLDDDDDNDIEALEQEKPEEKQKCCQCWTNCDIWANRVSKIFVIPHEGARSFISGTLAGAVVGAINMFLPHVAFWGEAQLQNMIDRGLSPLPIFDEDDEATVVMMSNGYCLVDASTEEGFGSGCALLIALAKIIVIGLSLGTGIVGGHFWGPLFVACAIAHAFIDTVDTIADMVGYGQFLAAYPAIVILCLMGSAHVVTFKARIAIALILTLTISSFGSSIVAKGDYAVVLPLLVIAVFVADMLTRHVIFYKDQRGRGDIDIKPEALCRPGMEGKPLVNRDVIEDEDSETGDGVSTADSIWDSVQSTRSTKRRRNNLVRRRTFGELREDEPDLLQQSRMRSASSVSGSFPSLNTGTNPSSSQRGREISVSNGDTPASSVQPEIDLSNVDRASIYLSAHAGFVLNNV